jgi:hypothetical protein
MEKHQPGPGTKTIKELAEMYKMTYRTFLAHIRPIRHTLDSAVRGKRILHPKDVTKIYEYMGPPE